MVWLSLGALFSLMLEIVYLGARLPVPGGTSIAFPVTIFIAFWFNGVLTRTAMLWTSQGAKWTALIPLAAWILGFVLLLMGPEVTGDMLLASNIRSVLLFVVGVAGGLWPLVKSS